VPFIRYNRDKRGFETTLVMHGYRTPQGGQQSRVLYLFRSPSNLQVGRTALDEEVVEALEHTHPDLTFDWPVLLRDRVETRAEPRPRPRRQGRKDQPEAEPRRQDGGTSAQADVEVDDQSLLGRVLGAAEAGRLRRRYAELLQRIARRARTPEDRDRLSERAHRLNPDDWPDEPAVRAGVETIEADLDAVAKELPQLRRGRRGGRRRGAEAEGPSEPSAIMEEHGDSDAVDSQQVAGTDRDPDARGNGRGIGTDPDVPEPDDLQG
jgi:hypothetical protein